MGRKQSAKLCGCRATAAATVFVDESVGGARGVRAARPRQVRAAPVPRHSPLGCHVPRERHVAPSRACRCEVTSVLCFET